MAAVRDHPYNFTSLVAAGEIADERERSTDSVLLSGTAGPHRTGDEYTQRAEELHETRPATLHEIKAAMNTALEHFS